MKYYLTKLTKTLLAYRIATLEDVILEFSNLTDDGTRKRINRLLELAKKELKEIQLENEQIYPNKMKEEALNKDKDKYCKEGVGIKKPALCQYKQCKNCKCVKKEYVYV